MEVSEDEVLYNVKSVEYDDKSNEVSRVVDEHRSILLLATVLRTRLFTVDLVDGNKLELI